MKINKIILLSIFLILSTGFVNAYTLYDDFETGTIDTGKWDLLGTPTLSTVEAYEGTYSSLSDYATASYLRSNNLDSYIGSTGKYILSIKGWTQSATGDSGQPQLITNSLGNCIALNTGYPTTGYWGYNIGSWVNTGISGTTGYADINQNWLEIRFLIDQDANTVITRLGSATTNSIGSLSFASGCANVEQIQLGGGRYTPVYWDKIEIWDYDTEGGWIYTPLVTNFTVTAKSQYSNSSITNFNVTIDGINYNTTSGSIVTHILLNDTDVYNITITTSDWFTKIYQDYNVSSNLQAELIQSEINFSCFEKVTNNVLTCLNSTIYPDTNVYNFTVGVEGYYNLTQENNVSALDNKTIIFNDFYSSNLTLTNNFLSGPGGPSTSCNYTFQGLTYHSYNEVLNGVSGVTIGLINGSYNITADCDGYAYSYETIVINDTVESVTFDLYTTNSIDISIFDETTGLSLNGTNITVTKILGAVQQVNITSTGTISYEELTAGNYTFNFEGDDYPARSYNVEIGNKTYQTLSVYLLANSTDKVIFTFQEYNNNLVIEGVTLQISKIINGTDTLIAVLNSDITGRTQFYFDTTERYCFVASKTSFTTKSWCLDPIIFTSYLIKLETSVSLSTGDDYEQILIDWTPKQFWNNVNNTISFTFANPQGSLTNYGFNATLDNGTSVSASGTNAYGSVLTKDLEILNSQYGDKVTVYYYYKKTGDANIRSFKLIYDIYGYNATTDSLLDNPPDDYGLGEFEKTLISVSITVLVGGAGALFGGPVAGGVMALFMFAWLMYIAFLNFWVGIISIILLFVVVSWRSSQ